MLKKREQDSLWQSLLGGSVTAAVPGRKINIILSETYFWTVLMQSLMGNQTEQKIFQVFFLAGSSGFHRGLRDLFALRLHQSNWDKAKARLMEIWLAASSPPVADSRKCSATSMTEKKCFLREPFPAHCRGMLSGDPRSSGSPQFIFLDVNKQLCPITCCCFLCNSSAPALPQRNYYLLVCANLFSLRAFTDVISAKISLESQV